jgi:hypothetical protein
MVQWPDWGATTMYIGFVYYHVYWLLESRSLTRWMKATSGTDWESPSNSTVRYVALGSGWKYGENFSKSQKRQE